MWQTRTICPGAVTGTRGSAIQDDGGGWPEPAHAPQPAEDRFCGAPLRESPWSGHQVVDPGLFEVFAVCYRVGDVFLGDDAYRLAGGACRTMRALAPACFIM
jgi:hypothetical protein